MKNGLTKSKDNVKKNTHGPPKKKEKTKKEKQNKRPLCRGRGTWGKNNISYPSPYMAEKKKVSQSCTRFLTWCLEKEKEGTLDDEKGKDGRG